MIPSASVGAAPGNPGALTEWLFSLKGPSLKWDLETARAFVHWLGDPERTFPAVHIAGTNGKGSVGAFINAIALESGLSAGLYTSPHLVRPEERIRINGTDIDTGEFCALVERLRVEASTALAAGELPRHPSFFEMMTAAAFVAFAEARVGLGVIETGLGGRLDATNVIVPRLTVITTIGLDHVKTLGGTLAAIAREKSGTIKPGVPVLAGWIGARPRAVIEEHARAAGAPLHVADSELRLRVRRDGAFDLRTPQRVYEGLRPALAGPHQVRNAALAVRASELLVAAGIPLLVERAARGVAAVRWPGRFERIGRFLLDGAHNPDGARALSRTLAERDAAGRPRRVLVFGVTEGRDPARLLAPLAPHVDRLIVTAPGIAKAVDPARVHARLSAAFAGLAPALAAAPHTALASAEELAGPDGEVPVAGSLYLVGDARRILLGLEGPGHPLRETRVAPATTPRAGNRP